ncbi:RsbT co-antagonist protein RsbRD [Sporosarcina sp. NCCP-2716]|uniref:STAS domain-containing protein n=1 Tax=Sporosarcina sp. NCCP-2716 TaxID=2943679 RepID=UPI00203A7265|nr:STAS domain-containing protein [Sporosarcina sp. NCCP-2716]GKV69892.1 RsbT co-antagonist protein RsbRD [Sporosarcina sp. NCCP-2716]
MGNGVIQPEIKQFIDDHHQEFEQQLLIHAVTVNDKIEEILRIGNIDLINNAHKLVTFVSKAQKEELLSFARVEGIAWAKHSLTLAFKLEWVSAIRRTMWDFIKQYIEDTGNLFTDQEFFELEKKVNSRLDVFLNEFFLSYSSFKDEQISMQRALVEDLSVPIIPVTETTSILPLIGKLDYYRTTVIQEKVLFEISRLHIQTLILDMSGIVEMEEEVIDNLGKVIDSTRLMGCEVVITGLRPDVVRKMANFGRGFDSQTKTYGTLQRAIQWYL